MINIDMIDRDILDLETKHDTTWVTVERLSWLYVVRDHLISREQGNRDGYISSPGESDFIKKIQGKDQNEMWRLMDELMDCCLAIHPELYNKVMRKIDGADE